MGAEYTRQSAAEIVDGEVAEAADFNNEFNQIEAFAAASTGHTHDGTTAEGGPVTKLLGTAITIGNGAAATDIVITVDGETNDGVITWMEDEDYFKIQDDVVINSTERLYLFDQGGEYLSGDGTNLTITSGGAINLTAVTDVVVPANVGVTFGTGEKIEGDNTDLTVTSGGAINLTAVTDVVVPANVGVTFGTGEKIEGDNTDLTVTSGGAINLTATTDVVVPANVGVTFGTGEKIEGDNTDLTVTSGADINLTATADVNIPANVGVTFGDDGEKIEGDGTNLTISSSNNLTLDATGDIILDADGADVTLKDAGTTYAALTNATGQLAIKSGATPTTAVTFSGANADFAGTLDVTGATTLDSTLSVKGNVTLGDAATDTVTITADVASNVIPSADSTYTLGDASNYWSHGYIDAITTTGNVTVGGDLTVTGSLSAADTNITNVGDIALDSISADSTEIDILLTDNIAAALEIKEGVNAYLTFVTTNAGEQITLGKKLAAGSVEIEGSNFDITGGSISGITDLALADGGTGASTAAGARTNLGLVIGTDVQAYDAGLADIAGLAVTDGNIIVGNGTNWVAESGATARTSLGLSIGTDVQAYDAGLADIAGLAVTDGNIIVGDGANWVAESGATARTSLGLAIGTDVQAYDAGLADIAGLAVTDGNIIVGNGTNWVAESGATARASLGLAIGTDVQAYDAGLADIAGLAVTDGNIIVGDGANWVAESGATARTSLGLAIGTDVQAYDAGLADIAGLAKTDGNIIVGNGSNWVAESGATARASLGITAQGKNLIINGAMTVAQRGTNGTILSGFDSTTNSYIADRFLASGSGTPQNRADLKHVSSGGPSGFPNFIRYDVTTAETAVAAGESSIIQQRIEGFNLQSIQASSGIVALTLQFYMRSPKTGTHCVYLSTQNTRNIVKEFTVTTADTWEKHTVSFVADASGGTVSNAATEFLRVGWPIIAGTTYQGTADAWTSSNIFATSNQQNLADNTANNIDITGVQLEVGSVATDFEHEDYGTTLKKCYRYFQATYIDNNVGYAAEASASTSAYTAMIPYLSYNWRATPTASIRTNANMRYRSYLSGFISATTSSTAGNGAFPYAAGFYISCGGTLSGLTDGMPGLLNATGTMLVDFSAEL